MLQVIVVFIVDLSGVISSIKRGLSYLLTKGKIVSDSYSLPLIGCSLCLSYHLGWIYLLITNHFTIPLFTLVCILSFFTPVTKEILLFMKDGILKLINSIC